MIIVGLCLDGGRSFTGRLFRSRVMQFMGRISMAVYLVHYPIILWMNFAIHGGSVEWVGGGTINPLGEAYFPVWAIPIHFVASILAGVVLTIGVEELARKMLQKLYKIWFESGLKRNQVAAAS